MPIHRQQHGPIVTAGQRWNNFVSVQGGKVYIEAEAFQEASASIGRRGKDEKRSFDVPWGSDACLWWLPAE